LFFVRSILEGAAAEIATVNARSEDFEMLEQLDRDMDENWKKKDAKSFLRGNYQFHNHINSLAGNSALQSMIDGLYLRTGPWLAHGITTLVDLDAWQAEHRAIIQALRERNAKEVRQLVEEDAQWGVSIYRPLADQVLKATS
jgi:DNA-binding GntR family transcriptional regulator